MCGCGSGGSGAATGTAGAPTTGGAGGLGPAAAAGKAIANTRNAIVSKENAPIFFIVPPSPSRGSEPTEVLPRCRLAPRHWRQYRRQIPELDTRRFTLQIRGDCATRAQAEIEPLRSQQSRRIASRPVANAPSAGRKGTQIRK